MLLQQASFWEGNLTYSKVPRRDKNISSKFKTTTTQKTVLDFGFSKCIVDICSDAVVEGWECRETDRGVPFYIQ